MKYEHIGPLHRKLFHGGGMDKNVGHHGWKIVKKFKITLQKGSKTVPKNEIWARK